MQNHVLRSYSSSPSKHSSFLQIEDLADVSDAAVGQLLVVLTHLVCGLREHQVPAFTPAGAEAPAVRALVVLKHRHSNREHL